MIEALAWKIAKHIKSVAPDHPAPVENLNHSLIIFLNFITVIGLTVIGSFFTGHGREAAILLISFAILRQLTGGLHLESSTLCAVATAGAATLLSLISINYFAMNLLTFISVICVLAFAPAGIEEQTIIPEKFYPILKVSGIVIVVSNFWIGSTFVAIAFFAQGFMLVAYAIYKGGEQIR